jgi:hypothetical protein
VRRALNRPPQPADSWWAEHQSSCRGTFEKISSPEKSQKGNSEASGQYLQNSSKKDHIANPKDNPLTAYFNNTADPALKNAVFSGKGHRLGRSPPVIIDLTTLND